MIHRLKGYHQILDALFFSGFCFPSCGFTQVEPLHIIVSVTQDLGPSSLRIQERAGSSFTVSPECANLDQKSFPNDHCGQKVENIPESSHNDM